MNLDILSSSWFRPCVFITCFAILCFFEVIAPKRKLSSSKNKRWPSNLGLALLNTIFLKVFLPFNLVVITVKAHQWHLGLFNFIDLPVPIEIMLSLILFDFFIYLQHIATHRFSILWKLHRVHHADIDLDLSSGVRFHTIEIFLSFLFKTTLIFLIGPSPASIILFEIILNSMAMINHSNIFLPQRLDKILRLFVVTPDMHRVHHSVEKDEYNTNFGFNLSLWDFLFKTYKSAPRLGQLKMKIGLPYFREVKYISLSSLIKMPLLKDHDE